MRVFGVSAVRIGNVLQTLSRFEKSGGNQLFLVGSEGSLFTKKNCSSPSHERVVLAMPITQARTETGKNSFSLCS